MRRRSTPQAWALRRRIILAWLSARQSSGARVARAGESIATVVFGVWFIASLVLAFRAIRRDDVPQHRRWLIRAFAVGVGTIRIWVATCRRS